MSTRQRVVAVSSGAATTIALALVASEVGQRAWPAYAAAAPTRAYSTGMLVGRLVAGAACMAAGAAAATRVARDDGASARALGAIVFAVSLWHHVVNVWAEYPVWYHLVYLSYLVPVAVVAGGRRQPRDVVIAQSPGD